jgi:hypothetical protein
VGKKAVNVISNSECDNDNESLYSSIIDDKEILDCLLNLPCVLTNRQQKKRHMKCRKIHNRKISSDGNKPLLSSSVSDRNIYFCNSTVEQCYLNFPENMVEDNPLDLENIKERQDEDDNIIQSTVKYPTRYSRKTIKDVEDILCYTKPGDKAANWRISFPEDLTLPTIKWYHQATSHPGSKRLYEHLRQRYYHRDLHQLADNLSTVTSVREIS